ncbi:MAG: hypothetical protein EU549_01300 [Promethearchaeota archaeon]|nr:MAG: hypothetical protein EU549_01300 [Candidatus Lokiarchaeota archaeon]
MNEWKRNRNRINLILVTIFLILQISTILTILSLMGVGSDLIFGKGLSLILIFSIIIISIEFNFILYLKRKSKLYSLPAISGFFIGAGLVIFNALMAFIIFGAIVSVFTLVILTIEAKKNENSFLLGLGIFFLIYGLSQMAHFLILIGIFHLISVIILIFGSSGFFNRNILVNKEEKEKIRNVWISKITVRGNVEN